MPIAILSLIGLVIFVSAADWAGEYGAPIHKGWNLVYGFASPEQLSGSQLVSSNIKAIYGFVPTTQEYIQVYPNKYNDLTMELKKYNYQDEELLMSAFWVYSDKTVEGSLNGKAHYVEYGLVQLPQPYNEVPLYKGWNFFGVTLDIIGKNMDDIKGDCNIEKIYNWDAESQQWSPGLVGATVGSGVLIKVANNCEFAESGAPEITPPPAIPIDCQDSDGGKVVDVKGTTSGVDWANKQSTYTDTCENGEGQVVSQSNYLREYYCLDNVVQNEGNLCPSGTSCLNGACI